MRVPDPARQRCHSLCVAVQPGTQCIDTPFLHPVHAGNLVTNQLMLLAQRRNQRHRCDPGRLLFEAAAAVGGVEFERPAQ